MSTEMPCCFIVNPMSGGGRTRSKWESYVPQLQNALGDVSFRYTEGLGSATALAQQAVEEGYRLFVSVGGDGTNNEVLNGLLKPSGELLHPELQFAFFPMGSGVDLRRSQPYASNLQQLIQQVQHGTVQHVDVGKVTFQSDQGTETSRFFLNISSIGMSSMVTAAINRSRKPLGGTAAYLWYSLIAMIRFQNPTMKVTLGDATPLEGRQNLIIVGNGKYFGGGMKAAPDAEMDDGLFDVVVIGDYSSAELILNGSKVYSGAHIHLPKTQVHRVSRLTVETDRPIPIDIDGELLGQPKANYELLHQRLPLRLP
ncbi:MAG: diacylglycerol kinase family lipid kinase [Deltaproteobacteria bacterium]|nr:MAG: diacylglycerol kinase family lipid kinase [Deltaproteobacteria bacterium]